MKKTYLITGGAGFIGSAIARQLIKKGNKVIVLDNFLTGIRKNIPAGAKFVYFNIADEKEYAKLKNFKIDVVMHLAAQSSGEISFDNPVFDLDVNLRGTVLLLDWCLKKGVRRFIYASSMAVYGENKRKPLKESGVLNPLSYYGINKLACEHYIKLYAKRGIDFTNLRMFNVYGSGQNIENTRQGMASIYLYYILKNRPIIVKGSRNRFRDFIYIDDVVECWVKTVNNKKTYGKTYNLGTGRKTTVEELLQGLIKSSGYKKYPVVFRGSTPGDIFGSYANIDLIKKDLG